MQQKALLITGGAGYVGSHTAWLLAQKGYRIIILDHAPLHHASLGWATYIRDDFASRAALHTIFSTYAVEAVLHFAAFIDVHASIKNPRQYYQNNLIKTSHLIDAMLEHGVRKLIFSSSCAVYGNPLYTPIDEQHPQNPITPYGKSKHMTEQILSDYAQAYDITYINLRYFNAAGAQPEQQLGEQHHPETHLVPLVLQALHNNTPFKIFGTKHNTPDGTCIRDFLHVRDIAAAHYLALIHLSQTHTSDSFNLGTGRGFSVRDIVDTAQQLFKRKLHIIYDEPRIGDPTILIANPTKANMLLQWQPHYSDLTYILRSAHEFIIQQQNYAHLLT
jgi:UDP-glucose 4-epimerase